MENRGLGKAIQENSVRLMQKIMNDRQLEDKYGKSFLTRRKKAYDLMKEADRIHRINKFMEDGLLWKEDSYFSNVHFSNIIVFTSRKEKIGMDNTCKYKYIIRLETQPSLSLVRVARSERDNSISETLFLYRKEENNENALEFLKNYAYNHMKNMIEEKESNNNDDDIIFYTG